MIDYTLNNNENAIISIAIYDGNDIAYDVYGAEYNLNYDYEIGSITKTFTAMLVSKAIKEGKVNLDDSISNYLELENRYYPTIKRIITHTSGLKPYYLSFQKIKNYFVGGNDFYNISKEQLLEELNKTKLEDKDYNFNYSNFGVSTLGLVLEKVYDKNYNELLEELLKQLDMNNTTIATGTGNLSGYWKWNENDGYIPAGAIISNIQDMSKYLETLITSDEDYVIRMQEALKEVNAKNDIYSMFDVNVDSVGMTWMIDNKNNIIWHNGSTTNFNSYIGFNREKKVGVVILSNISPQKDVNMTLIGNKIMHELLY
jgi:CubicO group peptidase (beta-lactamase class C family)